MSDTDAPKGKANTGWTDSERLAYLVSLIEHSDTKFNFKTAPRPAGRSVIACERMVGRLKDSLKSDLEALRTGAAMPSEGAAMKKTATPRKRKGQDAQTDGDADGGPKKKGRGMKKGDKPAAAAAAEDEEVKSEVKEEDEEV